MQRWRLTRTEGPFGYACCQTPQAVALAPATSCCAHLHFPVGPIHHETPDAHLHGPVGLILRVEDEPDGGEVAPAQLAQHDVLAVVVPLPDIDRVVPACAPRMGTQAVVSSAPVGTGTQGLGMYPGGELQGLALRPHCAALQAAPAPVCELITPAVGPPRADAAQLSDRCCGAVSCELCLS